MTQPTDTAYERARKRVKEFRDFYSHVIVYVIVNAVLIVLDVRDGNKGDIRFLGLNWAFWPLFGWGIAVVMQGLQLYGFGRRWEERKLASLLEEERRREAGG
jgi:hypothetical protein